MRRRTQPAEPLAESLREDAGSYSNRSALLMNQAIWRIAIKRHDGSELYVPCNSDRGPQLAEEITVKDPTGNLLRVRINSLHHERPKKNGLGTWDVGATEI